jgi:NitT/TauT family transport system substrate-binding protein
MIDRPKALALWFVVYLIVAVAASAAPAAAERVRVKLDGPIRGEHAIFFVARDKGYLKSEDVEMVVEEGGPALNTLLLLGRSRFEFGFTDLPSLIVARAQGLPVQALAVVNQTSPLALVALKGTGLTKPQDLERKTVGVQPDTPGFIFYSTLLVANRLDRAKIQEIPMPRPYISGLLAKKAQVVPGEIGGEIPALEAAVGGASELEILRGIDWGYDVLGGGLITSLRLLRVHPALARRFTRAYLRAFRDVIADPREAVAILVRSLPALAVRSDLLLRQLEASIPTFSSEDTKAHGLGWNPPDRWQHTHDALLRAKIIPSPINPITALYTNEFLGP